MEQNNHMAKGKIGLNKEQRRLVITMLVLLAIAGALLFGFAWRLHRWPALTARVGIESLPALSSTAESMVETAVADLPDSDDFDDVSFVGSPNGLSYALVTKTDGVRVVYNGVAGPKFDSINYLSYSPDGNNFAYTARREYMQVAVINGVEGKEYGWIFEPRLFTKDSQAFVYKARDDRGDMIVVNGVESQPYERIYDLKLTPDEKSLVFFARQNGQLWRGQIPLEISEK